MASDQASARRWPSAMLAVERKEITSGIDVFLMNQVVEMLIILKRRWNLKGSTSTKEKKRQLNIKQLINKTSTALLNT